MRKLINNKRGSILDIFIWIILSFVVVVFFATWMWGHNIITTTLTSIDTGDSNINVSDAAVKTFGQVNSALAWLRILAWVIIFAEILTIIISNFYVNSHPIIFIPYLFIIIAAVMFSVYISNYYETLISNDLLGSTITSFTGGSFIMLNLPLWTTIVGFIGLIFLTIGILRDRQLGGGI